MLNGFADFVGAALISDQDRHLAGDHQKACIEVVLVLGVDRAWLHRVDHDLIAIALQLGLECGAVHGELPQGSHQASAVYTWLATRLRQRTFCG